MSDDIFESDLGDDPFATVEGGKALSFKDAKVGDSYEGTVISLPAVKQHIDFESGKPAEWPDGNPVQTVVTGIEVDGEKRSLWAKKPSSMFRALQDAQKESGQRIKVGDTLKIVWEKSEKNVKNPRFNDVKIYKVVHTPKK